MTPTQGDKSRQPSWRELLSWALKDKDSYEVKCAKGTPGLGNVTMFERLEDCI